MIQLKKIRSIISIIILFVIFITMYTPIYATTRESNNITTRNLAMFASIAYADLEYINYYNLNPDTNIDCLSFNNYAMVTDKQLSTITSSTELVGLNLSGQTEDTYTYLFYNLASTDEVNDWKIVNYAKINSINAIEKSALFTAMTFKRDNDIVIAYRGTDFNDLGDWMQDLSYGLLGRTGQEELAKTYAIKIAETFPDSNIYVTGHSLGGYLAQIGGAALLESSFRDNVKEIGYFNGMGLYFFSNLRDTFLEANLITESTYNKLSDPSSLTNMTQASAKYALENWYQSGGKLISYHINGDPVSSLGTHCGKSVGFNAAEACINHHHNTDITFSNKYLNRIANNFKELESLIKQNSRLNLDSVEKYNIDIISRFVSFISDVAFNNNISPYIELYNPSSIIGYVWITHETDSFFGMSEEKLEVTMETPSTIKYNKKSIITVIVNTGSAELESTSLEKSDFIISNSRRLKILKVSEPTISKDSNNNNIYTYKVTVQGGIVIGNSRISLKANTLSIGSIFNRQTASNYIMNKLR